MGYPDSGMDITLIYKSCVKTIRARNRACGLPEPERPKIEKKPADVFSIRAKQVRDQIAKLGKLVDETKLAYLNVAEHIPGAPHMTDAERDRLDWGVPRLASAASTLLRDLEVVMEKSELKDQHRQHEQAVIRLLKNYLRYITGVHSDIRAKRVEKAQDAKRLSRLDVYAKSESIDAETATTKTTIPAWTPLDEDNDDAVLTPEELQVFEEENETLRAELTGVSAELQALEGKVVGIARLQDEFTQKVLEQEKDIDRVSAAVVGTTENIKDANDQLRQAIQRNAGFRVYILFFLLVMSFSLLFLDWYNF